MRTLCRQVKSERKPNTSSWRNSSNTELDRISQSWKKSRKQYEHLLFGLFWALREVIVVRKNRHGLFIRTGQWACHAYSVMSIQFKSFNDNNILTSYILNTCFFRGICVSDNNCIIMSEYWTTVTGDNPSLLSVKTRNTNKILNTILKKIIISKRVSEKNVWR